MIDAVSQPFPPIFDGHNDTVLSLLGGRSFFERDDAGGEAARRGAPRGDRGNVGSPSHIDLPRAAAGGLGGGFFAVFVPDPSVPIDPADVPDDVIDDVYGDPARMPPRMPLDYAQGFAIRALGKLIRLERESDGAVVVVRTAAELESALTSGTFAVELHLEGAEPIDPGLEALPAFYAAGLRSIGPVWSRSNVFASGVPFQFGVSPDTGPGLTDAGRALIAACNELGILVDVSHLNEKGFWDIAGMTRHPIVATHCGAHALAASTRNLTDKQLDAIGDSDGVVGINFHVGFLHPEGSSDGRETSLTRICDHLDYVAGRIGIEHVALGSDFDGATMPTDLGDAAGLPALMAELRRRGHDDAALTAIATGNWLRVFRATWGA